MHIIKVDPRALNENADDARQSKSSAQADALLLATVKAVGIIQPPVVSQVDGGNGYVIQAGHRRVQAAIAAGLEEIEVLLHEAANDNGAMRSMAENIVREPMNPVDRAASWWQIANGLSKTGMVARDASFGDALREAYGTEWADDPSGSADQGNRFTTCTRPWPEPRSRTTC
jgi:ParB family chromosome partitioning protein